MPNENLPIITPKALSIILLATFGHEVGSFVVQLPEQLLIEAKSRLINLGIQYGSMAVGQAAVNSQFVDIAGPSKLFNKGIESLLSAQTLKEASARGTIAAATLILAGASTNNPGVSMAYESFLLLLAQNLLFSGSQIIFVNGLYSFQILMSILPKIIAEIKRQRKRKKLGLPREEFRISSLFKKGEPQPFVFKCIRLKRKKIRLFSRNLTLFLPYEKHIIIEPSPMVKHSPVE